MIKQIQQFFQQHFEHPNYLYFLISLLMMLILPSLASMVVFGNLLLIATFGIVVLMACIYVSRSYKDLLMLGGLGITTFILFILNVNLNFISILNPIITLFFFGLVFIRLMQYTFSPKSVTMNDIYALCSGYLVLGIIAAPFFFVLDMQFENAFSIDKGAEFYDLLYFSYITLTGVGYGDIVPVHKMAKSLALVLGIIGQLYLAILVGIIIGKYLTPEN